VTAFAADLNISEILFLSLGKVSCLEKKMFSQLNFFLEQIKYKDKILKEEIAIVGKTKELVCKKLFGELNIFAHCRN